MPIFIVASLTGVTTWPRGGPYGSSRHAVLALAEQAALELQDSNVSVSVVCPALVRTSMSEEGADPLAVARQALGAAKQGRFAVIPEEWHAAVRSRADRLTAGSLPILPTPHDL